MRERNFHLAILSSVLFCCGACAPESADKQPSSTMAEESPIRSVYVSAKRVSTDCGVEFVAPPPPGLAEVPGVALREMSKPMAKFMAVGAGRETVETDWDRVSPGFVLIEPGSVKQSFLINNRKEVVATFESDNYVGFSQLLPNGNRLASSHGRSDVFVDGGGYRGCIEEISPAGDVLWRLNLNTDKYIHHHDAVKLGNGNILAIVWEKVSAGEAISQGRDPKNVAENGFFWYDAVIEVNPYTTEIVWEWSMRHHLVQDFDAGKPSHGVVADHPELLDINKIHRERDGSIDADWTHVNALDYNPELEQIILSSNYLSEVWVIDHSTTPMESMGHAGGRYGKGGDFLYRWGNPANYNRGSTDDRTLFAQHDVQWIAPGLPGEGHFLIFNNGDGKLRPYSTVIEFVPEMNVDGSYVLHDGMAYGPATLEWEYSPEPPARFFSFFISGAQRLPNGNTLVNEGAAGKVREITASGDIVWDYTYRDAVDAPHMLFRANRYAPDHPGVVGLVRSDP